MMKKLLIVLKYIINHPSNYNHKLSSIIAFFKWQFSSRLKKTKTLIDWVDNTKFLAANGDTGLTGNIYCGFMEYEEMSFLLHFIKKTDISFDIGANVGAYTILASGVRGCHSICFEPLPASFDKLTDQIKINGIDSFVDARNVGVGHENDKLEFTNNLDCMNNVNTDPNNKNITEVDVINLDSYFDPKSPTIVKIDDEGYEKFVLDGGSNFFLNPNVLALIVELSSSGNLYGHTDVDIDKKISSFGFKPISYDPFTREVNILATFCTDKNTIYVKNFDDTSKRCLESESFCVHTANDIII